MNKKIQRAVVIVIAAALLLTVLLPAITIFAQAEVTEEDIESIKNQITATEQRKAEVEARLASIRNDLAQAREAVALVQEQVLLTEQQIGNIQKLIDDLQGQIDESQAQLDEYDAQIRDKENNILDLEAQENVQREEFYAQVRWMEETGTVSYLSILFEAASFTELLDYATLIADIMEYSNRIIHRLQDTEAELAAAREDLQAAREAQAAVQANLEDQKTMQEEQRAEMEEQKAQLQKDKAEATALMNRIAASESEFSAEARRLANEEAQLQADLKRAEEEFALQLANMNNTGPWYWPLPGKYGITSLFGGRYSPIYGNWESHTGTDIGNAPTGTEIHAAQGGIVTLVGTNRYSSYGYYCIISHGNGYATLYAHQSRVPLVSVGQTVQKGEVIGYVGSTGSSTAPHLHFELRIDGVRADVLQLYPNTSFYGIFDGVRYEWKGNNYPF